MAELKSISLENEAGFRVLFEFATISIIVVNQEGTIELSNPYAENLFGYDATELLGKPIEILVPKGLRKKHQEHRTGYFTNPKTRPMGQGLELYASKKNGDVFPVEISLGYYKFSNKNFALAFITDITEQVTAKKIVAEREAWFRNMADNSPVKIWVSGSDGKFIYFNNTWIQFTGRQLEQELGLGWTESLHPLDLGYFLNKYNSAFNSKCPVSLEFRLRNNKGGFRWVLFKGHASYSSENTFLGYMGSCTDIHDQRMMHEELEMLVKQRTTELHEALNREMEINELKTRFVSMASHEFRSPLSVILSSTELVYQYLPIEIDNNVKKHLNKIKTSVKK